MLPRAVLHAGHGRAFPARGPATGLVQRPRAARPRGCLRAPRCWRSACGHGGRAAAGRRHARACHRDALPRCPARVARARRAGAHGRVCVAVCPADDAAAPDELLPPRPRGAGGRCATAATSTPTLYADGARGPAARRRAPPPAARFGARSGRLPAFALPTTPFALLLLPGLAAAGRRRRAPRPRDAHCPLPDRAPAAAAPPAPQATILPPRYLPPFVAAPDLPTPRRLPRSRRLPPPAAFAPTTAVRLPRTCHLPAVRLPVAGLLYRRLRLPGPACHLQPACARCRRCYAAAYHVLAAHLPAVLPRACLPTTTFLPRRPATLPDCCRSNSYIPTTALPPHGGTCSYATPVAVRCLLNTSFLAAAFWTCCRLDVHQAG